MDSGEGKELPLFSPISLLVALAAAALLVGIYLWQGGLIFNPGPLSAAPGTARAVSEYSTHAGFERECGLCHRPFAASQAELCSQCHQDVAQQVAAGDGLHGRLENPNACRACHPDHRGRDFSPLEFALTDFDHSVTRFALTGQHATAQCADCHASGYTNTSTECSSCHAEPAVHAGLFPLDCTQCHTADAWQPARLLEHAFPLDHGGQLSACATCHAGAYTQYTCYGCHEHNNEAGLRQEHAEEGIGADRFPDCAACHLDGRKPNDD